jgi:hypothetical protein
LWSPRNAKRYSQQFNVPIARLKGHNFRCIPTGVLSIRLLCIATAASDENHHHVHHTSVLYTLIAVHLHLHILAISSGPPLSLYGHATSLSVGRKETYLYPGFLKRKCNIKFNLEYHSSFAAASLWVPILAVAQIYLGKCRISDMIINRTRFPVLEEEFRKLLAENVRRLIPKSQSRLLWIQSYWSSVTCSE